MKYDCETYKFVYRKLPFRGGYWRRTKYSDTYVSLSEEFPAAAYVSQCALTFTIRYIISSDDIRIWKDKHGNIIVRLLRTCNKQTKIDFDVQSNI